MSLGETYGEYALRVGPLGFWTNYVACRTARYGRVRSFREAWRIHTYRKAG